MPINCPIGLIPFFAPAACRDCSKYDSEQEACCWYFPPRPLTEILDTEERLLRQERTTADLEKQLEDLKAQLGETGRPPRKSSPKLTGGVKL